MESDFAGLPVEDEDSVLVSDFFSPEDESDFDVEADAGTAGFPSVRLSVR